MNISRLSFYYDKLRSRIDTSTQPQIEDIGSSATDSMGQTVADSGLIPDALDGSIKSRTTLVTDGQTDEPFIAIDAGERMEADFIAIAGMNMRDSFPAAVSQQIDAYHHTADLSGNPQGTATLLAPSAYMAGILGAIEPYLSLDGVDDIVTIADDADLDWGNGNGSIEMWVYMPDVTVDTFWISRHQNSSNRILFFHDVSDTEIELQMVVGGVIIHLAEATWIPSANTWYHIVYTFENGASNAIYVDGVSLTLNANTITGGTFDIAAALTIGERVGVYYKERFRGLTWWNRALSAAEVLARYNGGVIAVADQDANSTELTSGTLTVGARYVLRDWITADDFTNVGAASNADGIEFIATGTTPTTWANLSKVVKIGAVGEWAPDGINKNDGKWYDSSTNSLDGTISGARYHLTPAGDKYEFYLAEFTEASARYWFIKFNDDGLTGSTGKDFGFGQIWIGSKYTPAVNPNFGNTEGADYSGVVKKTSYGGDSLTAKKYGRKRIFEYSWSEVTQAQKEDWEVFFDEIGGTQWPFLLTEDGDKASPLTYGGQLIDDPQWTYAGHDQWSLTIRIREL